MISRISNTATLKEIESYLDLQYQFKHLYKPQIVINGMEESTVSVVTSQQRTIIQFGIWGILPQGYNKEWRQFQKFENTLITNFASLEQSHWLYDALKFRRCLVIITGYFNYYLDEKNLKPVYSSRASEKILCLAGIYNQTEDGFLTFTILTKTSNHFHTKTSFAPVAPIIFSEREREFWIGNENSPKENLDFLEQLQPLYLEQYPVTTAIMGRGKKTMQMLQPL